jgi:hypothetical protein
VSSPSTTPGCISAPPAPHVPEDARAHERFSLRYEDVAQDGRLMLPGMLAGLGATVWRKLVSGKPIGAMYASGVVPIMRRLVFDGAPGPFSVVRPMEMTGRIALAHEPDAAGDVQRIFLNMWLDADAPHGSTYGPPASADAPRARAASLFAEHVLTRLFAPKESRRVRRVEIPGVPPIPDAKHVALPADELTGVPDGADALGDPVERPWTFTMATTDSNQHVNSLYYPRLFEDLAIAHLGALGAAGPTHLARQTELRWHRPFFAGDSARVRLCAFRHGERVGVSGGFYPEGSDRVSAGVRMLFEP